VNKSTLTFEPFLRVEGAQRVTIACRHATTTAGFVAAKGSSYTIEDAIRLAPAKHRTNCWCGHELRRRHGVLGLASLATGPALAIRPDRGGHPRHAARTGDRMIGGCPPSSPDRPSLHTT
jgi:hypothetical protein